MATYTNVSATPPAWWMGGLLFVAGLAVAAYLRRRTRFDPTIDE
jgi:MYXO-CTERM domain-containing protein